MASFSESIMTLLIVNENCSQHSLELGNCQEDHSANVDSTVLELSFSVPFSTLLVKIEVTNVRTDGLKDVV